MKLWRHLTANPIHVRVESFGPIPRCLRRRLTLVGIGAPVEFEDSIIWELKVKSNVETSQVRKSDEDTFSVSTLWTQSTRTTQRTGNAPAQVEHGIAANIERGNAAIEILHGGGINIKNGAGHEDGYEWGYGFDRLKPTGRPMVRERIPTTQLGTAPSREFDQRTLGYIYEHHQAFEEGKVIPVPSEDGQRQDRKSGERRWR